MKKNVLFSLALCAGLMLPTANFGAEQSWYNWAREGISRGAQTMAGYMPQWPNLSEWANSFVSKLSERQANALFIALVAFFGYGSYRIAKSESKELERGMTAYEYENREKKQKETAVKTYRMVDINLNNPYDANNLRNIAIFLDNAADGNDGWKVLQEQYVSDRQIALAKMIEKDIDRYIFNTYIFRILTQLPIPQRPQALVDYEEEPLEIAVQDMLGKLETLQSNETVLAYYENVRTFWNQFINTIKQNNPALTAHNRHCLEIFKTYLENTPDGKALAQSITDALQIEPGKSNKIRF
jgi:hypothetical protein